MFADNLKKQMDLHDVSQADLARLSGIGKSSISQYLSGKNEPGEARKAAIAEAVGCSVEELDDPRPVKIDREMKINRLDVKTAAWMLGMSPVTVRKGLQQGVFPWGYAIHTDGRWSYFINAKKFAEIEGLLEGRK